MAQLFLHRARKMKRVQKKQLIQMERNLWVMNLRNLFKLLRVRVLLQLNQLKINQHFLKQQLVQLLKAHAKVGRKLEIRGDRISFEQLDEGSLAGLA